MRTEEGKLKNKVKDYLAEQGVACLAKPSANAVGYYHMFVPMGLGSPLLDFTVCYKGRFLLIETKAPGRTPTPRQNLIKEGVNRAQGGVIIDDTWETLKLKLDQFFKAVDSGVA